jgi:hypothetical protein
MLQDLNVVEILRAGLSGLCFLLSLLAFWLIRQEQNRPHSPRKGILRIIYIFMVANLVSALLVAGLGYLNQKNTVNAAEPLSAKTYLIENTSFLVDLTKWSANTGGPAIIRRSDFVKKVSDSTADFVIPSYTNGDGINWKPISYSTQPTFTETHAPDQPAKHTYEYRLPLGREPKDHFELVASEFVFPSGFKDPKSEWWKAYVPYPSQSLSVVFRFPPEKPCRHIAVFREEGIKNREPITDNLPLLSNGGQVVMWTGLEIAADTRIEFDWDWDQGAN